MIAFFCYNCLIFGFLAEDRLADRLASAAKDKLLQTNKDKQVQAERKRKAAMFINMLKEHGVQGRKGGEREERGRPW